MSRELLGTLLIFCFLAQGYGANLEREVPYSARPSLEETRNKASEALNKVLDENIQRLNEVREEGEKIRKAIAGTTLEVDKIVRRALTTVSGDGYATFEEALRLGKDRTVFGCIIECESSTKKQLFEQMEKYKGELVNLEKEQLSKIDAVFQKVAAVENRLRETCDTYKKKIERASTTIWINWQSVQGSKQMAGVMKGSESLGEEFSGMLDQHKESAKGILLLCEETFERLIEEGRQCLKECLQR